MTNDDTTGGDGETSTEISFSNKYRLLRKYAHYLKTQLKSYSGESVRKDSTIERKLVIYKKLRKLIHYVDETSVKKEGKSDDYKAVKQVDTYYKLLEHKIEKLQKQKLEKERKDEIKTLAKKVILEKPKQIVESDFEDGEAQMVTSGSVSDDETAENELVTEIGPTPQLNGRVLTIFDIQTSPEQFLISPLKRGKPKVDIQAQLGAVANEVDDEVFKTPSKPVSQFGEPQSQYGSNYLASSSRKLKFDAVNTTPVKSAINVNINETPRYLRTQSTSLKNIDEIIIGDEWSADELDEYSDEENSEGNALLMDDLADIDIEKLPDLDENIDHINVEPSPIIKKMGRSLFDLHKDLIGLRRNLTDLEELVDDEDIVRNRIVNELPVEEGDEEGFHEGEIISDFTPALKEDENEDKTLVEQNTNGTLEAIDEQEEEIESIFDPHYKLRKKMKTIKRSTRRAKLRTDRVSLKDELEEIDIHALAFGKRSLEHLDEGLTGADGDASNGSGEDDDFAEKEEEYVRKDVKQLEKELNVGKSNGKGRHPLSNNFVRLKINRGRFKRRR
ncbi:hypothetical protein PMKS-002723 [Pichia membranifaciens]|uniref:DNA replication regulator SLD2 n=1 Tax=Pichia membranifaciens TaxID=4926 RepID=A0A1Q2YID5_9ASCO|nr:hypothetical protein PMKS-002723 [Pichia membranifaciens]